MFDPIDSSVNVTCFNGILSLSANAGCICDTAVPVNTVNNPADSIASTKMFFVFNI